MSTVTGIQGQPLEITVVACSKLKDTEWFSRQDPYVCLEYGTSNFRTRTCTDGGKNPLFHEKFVVPLIEGLRELNVVVWNSNTLTFDNFIGSGKIQLQKVLSEGFDDSAWPLQTKSGRYAGEVKLILYYANAAHTRSASSHVPSASPYLPAATPHAPFYTAPPPTLATSYPPPPSAVPYLLPGSAHPYPPAPTYTASSPYHQPSPYPPQPSYPPTSAYPPAPYPPPAGYHPGVYPPPPY